MIGKRNLSIILMLLLGSALTIMFQHIIHSGTSVFTMSQVKSMISNITLNTERKQHDQILVSSQTTTNTPWMPKVTVNPLRTKAEIFRWSHGSWEEWDNFCPSSNGLNVANLKTPAGQMKIFIHDLKEDMAVSGSIVKYGSWESDVIKLIFHYMSRDPGMHLLDIGSHVGQFSLMGAKMGRQVMAIDPLYENVVRLCNSIQHNKFSSQIKVFYTALSDTKTTVSFTRNQGNIGGTHIVKGNPIKSNATQGDSNQIKVVQTPSEFDKNTIQTVLLDDLLPFVSFKKAFMKIDVESHENYVLKGGDKFFKSVEIPYVFMEWVFHARNSESARQVIDFMKRHRYTPRTPNVENTPLQLTNHAKWPENVLWVKDRPM